MFSGDCLCAVAAELWVSHQGVGDDVQAAAAL